MALGQLNVGYRPLSPADDVAGLAGQKQAVDEFNALSVDEARRASALQAQAELMMKQQVEQAKLTNQARQIGVSAMNAMTSAAAQRASASAANQKLMLEHRMLPGKLEAIALANEAQSIDNAFAAENERAAIDGMRLRNEGQVIANQYADIEHQQGIERDKTLNQINANNLRDYHLQKSELATLPKAIDDLDKHLEAGGSVANWGGRPRYRSAEAQRQLAEVERVKRLTDAGQQAKLRADDLNTRRAELTPGQDAALKNPKFNTGEFLNDIGHDALNRMELTNKLLNQAEKDDLLSTETNGINLVPSIYEKIDGHVVLTQQGVKHFQDLKAPKAPKGFPTGTTTVEDPVTRELKVTTTRKPFTSVVNERWKDLIDKRTGGNRPPTQKEKAELYWDAIKQTAVPWKSEDQANRSLANGIPVYYPLSQKEKAEKQKNGSAVAGEVNVFYPEGRQGQAGQAGVFRDEDGTFHTVPDPVEADPAPAPAPPEGEERDDPKWRDFQMNRKEATGATGNYRDIMQEGARSRTYDASSYGADISPERAPLVMDNRQNAPYPASETTSETSEGLFNEEGRRITTWKKAQWDKSILPVKGDIFKQLTATPATKTLDGGHIPLSVQGRGLPDALAEEVISRNIAAKANVHDVEEALEVAFESVVGEMDSQRTAMANSMDFPDWWGHGSNREKDEINSQLIIESKQIRDTLGKYTAKEIVDRNNDDDKNNDISLDIPIQFEALRDAGRPEEKGRLNFSRHKTKASPGTTFKPGQFGNKLWEHKFTSVTKLEQFIQALEELRPKAYLARDINHYLADPVPIQKPKPSGYTDKWKPFTRK
jgi:hypothetical protein